METATHPREVPQAELISQAQQGNPESLALLINRSLHSKGIKAVVRIQGDRLHIGLRSQHPISQDAVVPFIQKGLERIGIASISTVAIYGLPWQSSTPTWRTGIILNQPSSRPTATQLLARGVERNGNGNGAHREMVSSSPSGSLPSGSLPSGSSPPVSSSSVINQAEAITAHIQAQTISGQVAIGNHILQIGHMSGGIVNVAPNAPRSPKAIDTPIFLTPRPFPNLLDRQDIMTAIATAFQANQSVECYNTAGFGKTSVLRYVAHDPQLTASFPDGVIYVSARRQPKADLLQAVFDAFYESELSVKPTEVQIRRALHSKKALLLLDDVELDRDAVQEVLDAVPACTCLLTGETQRLWGDDGVALPLPGLPIDDAIALVERTLQRSLSLTERQDATVLCEQLDGHPLRILQAIAVMQRKRWAIVDISQQIASAALAEQVTVQTAASLPDPEKRVLAALAVFGGTPVQAASLADMASVADISPVLQSLAASHLIKTDGLRYSMVDNLVDPIQTIWDLGAWINTIIDYFAAWSEQHAHMSADLLSEADALMHLIELALQQGRWADVLNLGTILDAPLTLSHQWGLWERSLQWQLQAAQAMQDLAAEAWAMHQLGTQALCLEDAFTANLYLSHALELRESLGETTGAAITRHNLSLLVSGPPPASEPEAPAAVAEPAEVSPPNAGLGLWLSRIALIALPIVLGGVGVWYALIRASAFEFTPNGLVFVETEVRTTTEPQPIQVTNTGKQNLELTHVHLGGNHPGDFAIVEDTCSALVVIAPDETCTITVLFQPTDAGTRTTQLVLTYDDGKKVQRISLRGAGTASDLGFEPRQLTFPGQERTTSSPAEAIALRNTGTAPLHITTVAIVGEHGDDFVLQSDGCSNAGAIAPDEICTIAMQFAPLGTGDRTAELVITSNALGDARRYTLRGTGIAVPRLGLDASTLNFQTQEIQTVSAAKTVTVTSQGTDTLSIDDVEIVGRHRGDFTWSSACASRSLEPGENCTISVRYQPTETGARTAELVIRSNARNEVLPITLQGTGTAAEMQLSADRLAFDTQEVGTTSSWLSVRMTNRGTAPLRIAAIALTDGNRQIFEQANDCQETAIAMGESCSIQVQFNPSETGRHEAILTIRSNAMNAPQQLQLSGVGTAAEVVLGPSTVTFPAQEIRTHSAVRSVQISNSGTAPLRIESVTGLEGDRPAFALSGCTDAVIAPGEQCTLNVTFAPTTTGEHAAAIVVRSNAQNGAQRLTLQGIGIAARIGSRPDRLSFGNQRVNTRSEERVQIFNEGTAPLRLGTITREGNHADDFTISGCANTTLEPDASCALTVRFAPTGRGDRSAQVIIPSNAETGTLRIPLRGVGTMPAIGIRPGTLSFGVQRVQSTSRPQAIELSNTGTAPLNVGNLAIRGDHPNDFAMSNCSNATLAPGQTCQIRVQFTPSEEGDRTATLVIPSDAENGPQRIVLQGVGGIPRAAVSPAEIQFGDQTIRTTSQNRTATITNNGTFPLQLGTLSLTGMTSDFRVNGCSNQTLNPRQHCAVTINFTPVNEGVRRAQLMIPSNAANDARSVILVGNGVIPGSPMLSVSPRSLDNVIGDVNPLTVTNTGTAPLRIRTLSLRGTNVENFSASGCANQTLQPGASCRVNVTFVPPTPFREGSYSATLLIPSNSVNGTVLVSLNAYLIG